MIRLVVLFVCATACNNDHNTTIDGAVAVDAARDAFVPQDAPAPHVNGQVAIAMGTGPMGSLTNVSATFTDGMIYGIPVATEGACTLFGPNTAMDRFSAGSIAVTGTNTAITLTPSGTPLKYTPAPTPPTDLYTAGATISVVAAGSEVPAFSATVTAPAALAGYTVPTVLSRAGYTPTWTAVAGSKIFIILLGMHGSTSDTILCRIDDTGTFTVPASTFALLPATDTTGAVAIARVAEHLVTTPDVSVVVVSELASGLIPINP
ncbi:MAG: hypothetical protein ABI591_04820 [Kofleriaceae bacterium]